MEKKYSIAEARNRLAALVHAAEDGVRIRLTRRGTPVAVILSEQEDERLTQGAPRFWDAVEAFRASVGRAVLSAGEDAFQDVRDRGPGRNVNLRNTSLKRMSFRNRCAQRPPLACSRN